MKKVKNMLKLPALALMCFGIALPLSTVGNGDEQVSARDVSGIADVTKGTAESFSVRDGYAEESETYEGSDLDLSSGDGMLPLGGLTTSAEWTFETSLGTGFNGEAYSLGAYEEYAAYANADELSNGGAESVGGESDVTTSGSISVIDYQK